MCIGAFISYPAQKAVSLSPALVIVGLSIDTFVTNNMTFQRSLVSQEEVAAAQVEQQIRAAHLDRVTAPHDSGAAAKPGTTLSELVPTDAALQLEPHGTGNGVVAADVDGKQSHLDVRMQNSSSEA